MNIEDPMKTTFMKLPNDLVLNCVARVSKLYYPSLSLVSKSFRSLIASPELYKTRTLLGRTESCLYVCLLFDGDSKPHLFTLGLRPKRNPKPRWFNLCFRPNPIITHHTKKKKSSKDNVLIPIPSTYSPHATKFSGFAVVGYNIYHIEQTTKVSFLDCRFHTWHKAPNMMVASKRSNSLVSVLDEKIYVTKSGTTSEFSPNWIEFFDPKTQIWDNMKILSTCSIHTSLAIEGKLYFDLNESTKHLVYNPKENSWNEVELSMPLRLWPWLNCCIIDDVVYGVTLKKLIWYDPKGRRWRYLEGKLPKFPRRVSVKIADYDGKMAVFWYKKETTKTTVWCAEIRLEKRNEQEIWGKVEWFGIVLKLSEPCSFWNLRVISARV